MTVVSSREFASHQDKYFEMAMNGQVFIQKGDNMFLLIRKSDDMNTYHDASVYEEILAPDEDFYRAIPADVFRERLIEVLDGVDKKHANKCR